MADSEIYITAFLTCLAKSNIFCLENYRLRKLKYHCLLITTFTFCGSEIEIEQTTKKPHQICTNNLSNRETLFLSNKRFFKSWRISFSRPFHKARLWKNSTLFPVLVAGRWRSQPFCMEGFLMYIACPIDNRALEALFTNGVRGHACPENF